MAHLMSARVGDWSFTRRQSEDEIEEAYTIGGTDDGCGDDMSVINLDGHGGRQGLEVGGWELDWSQVAALLEVIEAATGRWKEAGDGDV
jgi:hypothetical protein